MNIQLALFIFFVVAVVITLFILEIKYPSEITIEFFNSKIFSIRKILNKFASHFR